MLTADLVDARRWKGELRLRSLEGEARVRAIDLAARFLAAAAGCLGRTRDDLEEAWAEIEIAPRDRRLALGIRKLVEDRCSLDSDEDLDAPSLRREVFVLAATRRRGLGPSERFDRRTVLEEVGRGRGLSAEEVDRLLYSDLKGAQVLSAVPALTPAALVDGWDEAQAQAVLLRAVRLDLEVHCATPDGYRRLFRRLKFLRLLHDIRPLDGDRPGYQVVVDGPYSLFDQVTRYGLQLALILRVLRECDRWRLRADLRWGKSREALSFHLDGGGGEEAAEAPRLPDDLAALQRDFAALGSRWGVRPADVVLERRGAGLCVPDLVFEAGSERVYLEALGFWSREAVWRRIELVEQGLGERVVFAVGEHLRVSEKALGDDLPSALYVYKRTMSARALLAVLERLCPEAAAPAGGRRPAPRRAT